MLNKIEDKIMCAVRQSCGDKTSCLVSPYDLIKMVGLGSALNQTSLERVLLSLSYDGYFDVIYSDRKGEKIYCITLHEKGFAYQREKLVFKRNLRYKLFVTVFFAVLSFIIGLILKKVF